MNPKMFFGELKRRNVYKVAVTYVVAGWALAQGIAQVFPIFDVPSWVIRLLVLLIVVGFPIALIVAWVFELTPEGLKRTEAADAAGQHSAGHVWIYVVIIAGTISLGLFFLGRYTAGNATPRQGDAAAAVSSKSIAVLPFANLSRDPDNAYFAEGVQDEILTRLAKIAELKVIARTSTQKYKSAPDNLHDVAKQLGVANILEGSVQRSGDLVHVNVQLIRADSSAHLWAESYDCKLSEGVFAVEVEVAQKVASALHAKLTGAEEQALVVKPTNNPEAYDAYLRGLAFDARSSYSGDATRTAIDSYERAVQLDPNFALAWARLSRANANAYFRNGDTTVARRDAAKRALENAQKLQPNSPETLLALGYYQYWVLRGYGLAKTTFELVRKILPGNSEVLEALGAVTRREGSWDESVEYWEQALALDPRNPELLSNAAFTFAILRQFPDALRLYDRALDLMPNDSDLMAIKATIYQAQGNLHEAAKFLTAVNAQTPSEIAFGVKLAQLRLERNHGEAIQLLETRLAQFPFGSEMDKGVNQMLLALAQRLAGDDVPAKVTAEQACKTFEPLFENQPDNSDLAAVLALANAVRGEKDLAFKTAERAIVLLPSAKDRVSGPALEANLALIQAMFGDTSRAISTLTRLLQAPCSNFLDGPELTRALLNIDPLWDPLRADPAFQKLCEEKQP
jgi:TolB-like protein/Tfp pilus assembly protein PilF